MGGSVPFFHGIPLSQWLFQYSHGVTWIWGDPTRFCLHFPDFRNRFGGFLKSDLQIIQGPFLYWKQRLGIPWLRKSPQVVSFVLSVEERFPCPKGRRTRGGGRQSQERLWSETPTHRYRSILVPVPFYWVNPLLTVWSQSMRQHIATCIII